MGPRGELSRMYPSYSVPNLYSDGQLKAFAKNPEIGPTQINSVYNPRYVIIGSNGVLNDNKQASESRDCSSLASSLPEKNIAERTKKIVQYIDSLPYKTATKQLNGGLLLLKNRNTAPLVIYLGPPGSGDNFTAKWLFAKLLEDNRDAIGYCLKDPHECCYINAEKKAVVLLLGANGRNEFNRTKLDACQELVEEYMPTGMKRNDNTIIIMTMTDYDEMKGHRFLSKYAPHVIDAKQAEYRPSIETIRQLIKSIATHHNVLIRRNTPSTNPAGTNLDSQIIVDKTVVDSIPSVLGRIGHIRRLNDFFRNHTSNGIEELRCPDPILVSRIRQYERDNPSLFLPFLAVHAHRGKLRVGRLEDLKHMNHHMDNFWQSLQNLSSVNNSEIKKLERGLMSSFPEGVLMIKYARKRGKMADLARTLEVAAKALDGTFLDEHNGVYEFLNGNVFFSFLVVLCQQYPEAIETCDSDFFFKYVKPKTDLVCADECLFVDTSKKNDLRKHVMVRFRNELLQNHVEKCMTHPVMLPQFFDKFLKSLDQETLRIVLQQHDISSTDPFTILYYGLHNHNSKVGVNENNTDVILRFKVWKDITKANNKDLKEWAKQHNHISLMHAIELKRGGTFRSMVTSLGLTIPVEALEKAITYQCAEIIDTILKYATFTETEWYAEVVHAFNKLCSGQYHFRFVAQVKKMVYKVDIRTGVKDKKIYRQCLHMLSEKTT